MNFDWLKKYMPRGLYGRAALILIVPVFTLLLAVSVVFVQRHYADVTRQMTRVLALDLRLLLTEVDRAPDLESALANLKRVARPLQLRTQLPVDPVPHRYARKFYDISGHTLVRTLKERAPAVRAIDLVEGRHAVQLWLDTRHGVLKVAFSRDRVSASNPHQFLVLMAFVGLLMTAIAFLYLRNQLRPIKRLARAAEAFGRGEIESYRPSGAVEVRAAGNAFLNMRSRIERQIEQRTMMLSGVSHDLRTPLTRLRLGLSMIEDQSEVKDLERDIQDMEQLLEAFLAFARDDALDDLRETDLAALVRDVASRAARSRRDVSLGDIDVPGTVRLRPMAIERALGNLVENALRYGTRARLSATSGERSITISVEDDGPGIPEDRREEALKPFARLDAARNQDRGSGVGLGLAIASDIARRHGGALRLGQSDDLGGLRVDIVLPL